MTSIISDQTLRNGTGCSQLMAQWNVMGVSINFQLTLRQWNQVPSVHSKRLGISMANHYCACDWLIPDDIQFSQYHNTCQLKSSFGAKGLMELSRSSSARYCFTCHKI